MTPEGLAATHRAAFAGNGWPAQDFAAYLDDSTVRIFGDDTCFVVCRLAGPEAEVLTLATHPDVQGKGRATQMLQDALKTLAESAIEEVFLDVAADNAAARALYDRCGFAPLHTRRAYYSNGADALCMKAQLSPTARA